jgi:phage minor structural protein
VIVYFADRQLNIIGQASTNLPNGLTIIDDKKTEDVETGVAVFECYVPFDSSTRSQVEQCADVGNYILRKNGDENEFYTIIETEMNTKNQEAYVYAEDAGLDLLNEIVGKYEADKAYPIDFYVDMFAYDSGFIIGENEAKGLTRKLAWDGESTAAERIASVATQFDGCEVSYSFDINGLEVTNKYINIYKERGKDVGIQLRLNFDIDSIETKKSIANLATALRVTGGTPESKENENGELEDFPPITLKGYKYDDGDFYVDEEGLLKSREALKKWGRYSWAKEPNTTAAGGHIVRLYSYDTVSQSELCSRAISELKKQCQIEVNYEVDISKLPENVKIGDRVNIVDDAGELYVSARILKLETSVTLDQNKATIGEYLIKDSGISQKVADLAAKFALEAESTAKAYAAAQAAKAAADEARDAVTEEHTNILDASGEMMQEALQGYVQTNVFEEYVDASNTQMQVIADQTTEQYIKTIEQITAVNETLQSQINTITKYLTFDVNGLTIGQVDNPNKVVIDNDEIVIEVNGNAVQRFDANGKGIIPDLQVSAAFELLGYRFEKDANGNVNCEYVG